MRSELVFGATSYVSNRYLLVMLALKAARKLHRPNTLIEDTANDAFARFACAEPIADVPRRGNSQPFPCVPCKAKADTHLLLLCADLKRSAA
jgi:hypothetical protein